MVAPTVLFDRLTDKSGFGGKEAQSVLYLFFLFLYQPQQAVEDKANAGVGQHIQQVLGVVNGVDIVGGGEQILQ